MALAWNDLGGTGASAIGNVQFSSPFAGVNTQYVLTQQFMQPITNFAALALNTAHGTYASYKLVEERDFKDLGGGIQTWTRVYAATPSQRIELSTMNYNFIGFWGPSPASTGSDPSAAYGRQRKMHFVLVKHQFDYYFVDGSTIATQYAIPVVSETKYLGPTVGGVDSLIEVDFLWNSLMPGGVSFANASNPSLAAYKALMAADAGTASSFSIVAQGSSVRRWMGNIWERETLYIKAI